MTIPQRLSPVSRCLFTELGDGTAVVLHLDTKFYYTLNATGVVVWKGLAEGTATVDDIVARIVGEFETDERTARADVDKLSELLEEGLLEPTA